MGQQLKGVSFDTTSQIGIEEDMWKISDSGAHVPCQQYNAVYYEQQRWLQLYLCGKYHSFVKILGTREQT